MPAEKYPKIKEYLDKLNKQQNEEVVLDKESRQNMKKSMEEYSKGEYLTFEEVFEGGDRVIGRIEYNEERDTPLLIIDGKSITWEELGKMMMSYEGFQFRLDIADITEEFE